MIEVKPTPNRFVPLRLPEARLLDALRSAGEAGRSQIDIAAMPGAIWGIRAEFLRWYVLDALPAAKLSITSIAFARFRFEGDFDLRGCKPAVRQVFRNCEFTGSIDLTEATLPGIEFSGGNVTAILADRLTVAGSLLIRADDPFSSSARPLVVANGVSLNGAKVQGNFELDGAILHGGEQQGGDRLALNADGLAVSGNMILRHGFLATSEVRINGAVIDRNLDCSGARLICRDGYALSAAGAHIKGTVYFSRSQSLLSGRAAQFEARCAIRLAGAEIDGDLDCSGAHLVARAFALKGWTAQGGSDSDIYAMDANGLKVGADILLCGQFKSSGTVSLMNAQVGKDIRCEGAFLDSPGGEALCGDGMTVGGVVFLVADKSVAPAIPFRTTGVVRFVLAKIMQGFYVRNAIFKASSQPPAWLANTGLLIEDFKGPACGILARETTVGGTFMWKDVTCQRAAQVTYPCRLDLAASRADTVDDDLSSWLQLNRLDVTDCDYRSMSGLLDPSVRDQWVGKLDDYVEARLGLLDCEYAIDNKPPSVLTRRPELREQPLLQQQITAKNRHREAIDRFKPQPYLQFARVLRRAGLDAAAENVLVHLERNRTRYSGYGWARRAGRQCLFVGLRYGYSTFRPITILACWALFSAVVFESAYSAGRIVPVSSNQMKDARTSSAVPPRVQFNALVYAVDTLVPLVDLNQKKNWVVDPLTRYSGLQASQKVGWFHSVYPLWSTSPDRPAALLVIVNTFFGWLMTTLFAAGVTGFLRRGRDT